MKSKQIHPDAIVSRAVDILFSQVDDELLAVDEQAGYFYMMNESARRVWELIEEPMSVNAVCARLCQEFTVDEATCLREVLQVLHNLHEAGLVQVED
jgi:PqqD family protein of HPr-rel-A system